MSLFEQFLKTKEERKPSIYDKFLSQKKEALPVTKKTYPLTVTTSPTGQIVPKPITPTFVIAPPKDEQPFIKSITGGLTTPAIIREGEPSV